MLEKKTKIHVPHVRRNHRHWAQSRKKKSKAAAQQVTTVNIDSCRCQFANAIYADYLNIQSQSKSNVYIIIFLLLSFSPTKNITIIIIY